MKRKVRDYPIKQCLKHEVTANKRTVQNINHIINEEKMGRECSTYGGDEKSS